ncbi:MAG: ribonuclease P protein component [Pseudobdellovibrionaceae bacterium]
MESKSIQRLKRTSDYGFLREKGRVFRAENWLLWSYLKYHDSQQQAFRWGVTVPKKVGTAVLRNKMKRWCLEYFKQNQVHLESIDMDLNVVFIAESRHEYKKMLYTDFKKSMDKGLHFIQKVVE